MTRAGQWAAGLALVAVAAVPSPAHAAAASEPVKVNADAGPARSHVFPNLAANPADADHLIAVSVKRVGEDVYFGTCTAFVSRDGGGTWTGSELPVPPGARCQTYPAPKVVFTRDGAALAVYHAAMPPPFGVEPPPLFFVPMTVPGRLLVSRSDDGGATFQAPATVPGSPLEVTMHATGTGLGRQPGSVGMSLAADPDADHVYVAWDRRGFGPAAFSNPFNTAIWVARSADGGRTFAAPVPVSVPKAELFGRLPHVSDPALAVAGGILHLAYNWADCGSYPEMAMDFPFCTYSVLYSSSEDRAATFAEPRLLERFRAYDLSGAYPLAPAIAADPLRPRRVYVAYEDQAEGDIAKNFYLVRSLTGGATWIPPVRVSDDRFEAGYPHQRPALGVAPGGRLDVAWYDGRNDPTSPGTACFDGRVCAGRDVYLASSSDAGQSFSANFRVTPATFDTRTRRYGQGQLQFEGLGSIGLVSTAGEVRLVWEQSAEPVRVGDPPADYTPWDLYSARVTP